MPYFGPIIPPDSPLAVLDKSRHRKRVVMFASVAVVCFGLVAVAWQGCNRPAGKPVEQASVTNPLPVFETPPGLPAVAEASPATAAEAVPVRQKPPTPKFAGTRPYKIAKGENFDTIAKKFHVPVKVLEDANPGLEPKRLQIDQVIQIPIVAATSPGSSSQPGALTSR